MKKLASGKWQVRWRDETRRQRARNFRTKELAQDFLRKLDRGEVRAGSDLPFSDFAAEWLERYSRKEKAASQHVTDESAIRVHLRPALGHLRLSDLSGPLLERWRSGLRDKRHPRTGQPLTVKTLNHLVAMVKQMLRHAVKWGYLGASPAEGLLAFADTEREMAYWTTSERDYFLRFARHVDPELTELVLVALRTGLRRGELAGLERRQLDFENRLITVNGVFCFKTGQRLSRTKNGRIGYVPMDQVVAEALKDRKLLPPEAPVFNRDLCQHASTRLRRLCQKVGAKSIRFHDLRHTFASSLVSSGVPLFTVQKLMRHETTAMTQRYAHLAPGDLHEALRGLDGPVHGLRISRESEAK